MAVPRILTLALSCAAQAAWASPASDPTAGRAVFTGATMSHATSIVLNPAALGPGLVNEAYVAITGVLEQLHADLQVLELSADGTAARLVPGPRVRDLELAPGAMLAFTYHLAGFTIGAEARTIPRETFPDHQPAFRYHVSGGGERDWLASVGASYKVTGELYFGASLSHQNTYLRLQYARDAALDSDQGLASPCSAGPCGLGNPEATQLWDVDVRSRLLSIANLRVNVGVLYEIARDVWLGVGYHTPPGFGVQSELGGHVTITPAPRDDPDGTLLRYASVVDVQLPASADAEVRARLPLFLELHLGGRWEDLSRMQAYDVRAFGSTLARNQIPEWTERPRGMRDAFAGWAGVEQVDLGQAWVFGARAGFETAAVSPKRTSPLTVAPTSFTLDLGAQLRISRGVVAQLSYGLAYFPTVNVQDSEFNPQSRIACAAASFDYTRAECEAVRDGYAIATAAGNYERFQHAMRIGLRYDLP